MVTRRNVIGGIAGIIAAQTAPAFGLAGAAGAVSPRARSLITARNLTMGGGGKIDPWPDADIVYKVRVSSSSLGSGNFMHNCSRWPLTIDWGDGTRNTYTGNANRSHTYSEAGEYYIQFIPTDYTTTGTEIYNNTKIVDICKFDTSRLQNVKKLYWHACGNMRWTDCSLIEELPNLSDLQYMFRSCGAIGATTIPDLTKLHNLTNVRSAFAAQAAFKDIPQNLADAINDVNISNEVWPLLTVTTDCFSGASSAIRNKVSTRWGGTLNV